MGNGPVTITVDQAGETLPTPLTIQRDASGNFVCTP
jgi:hypothetical protein